MVTSYITKDAIIKNLLDLCISVRGDFNNNKLPLVENIELYNKLDATIQYVESLENGKPPKQPKKTKPLHIPIPKKVKPTAYQQGILDRLEASDTPTRAKQPITGDDAPIKPAKGKQGTTDLYASI